MKLKPTDKKDLQNITLPGLLLTVASMLMFAVFLTAMYFNFHTAIFFSLWIWIIAATLIYYGTLNKKLKKPAANVYIISGIAAAAAGIVIILI